MKTTSPQLGRVTHSLARVLLCTCVFTVAGNALGQTLWIANPNIVENWSTASNWSLGVPNASSGTTFDARIDNGGTAQLSVTGATVRRMRVGTSAGGGGLYVDAGGLTVTENLHLNEGGTNPALMIVQNGGSVTAPSTVVGYSSTGASLLQITGAGSIINATTEFITGRSGLGTLILADSGTLSIGSGSSPLQIATLAGSNGTAYIGNGAAAGSLQASAVQFGAGTGSLWFNHTDDVTFAIPISGAGNLTKTGSGTTTLSAANTYTGNNYGGTEIQRGTLEVTGSISHAAKNLVIGVLAGQDAALAIRSGGAVTNDAGRIGDSASSNGSATVDGAGSTWTNSHVLTVGNQGIGTLTIEAGGSVSSHGDPSDADIYHPGGQIGVGSGSTGSATVTGAGSTWTMDGPLMVGDSGIGTLTIEAGGRVITNNNSNGSLGRKGGSTGTVLVTGAGSTWTVGAFDVGAEGNGIMRIEAGGTVSSNTVTFGGDFVLRSHTGSAVVTGAGSTWTIDSAMYVGILSNGTLTIEDGGAVSTSLDVTIGLNPGVSGTATVTGPGSTLTSGGALYVGSNGGTGTLSVQNGGVASAANGISISAASTVTGDGTLVGNVTNSGYMVPGTSAGTLHVNGNYSQSSSGSLVIFADLFLPGVPATKLDVTGDVALDGRLQMNLSGLGRFRGTRSFDILDWGGNLSGMFSSLQLPMLGGTLTWDTSQLYVTGVLTLIGPPLEGDFNADGIVDAADYVVWRKGLGTTYTQADYDVWRAHFGQTAGSAGSGAIANVAVPEPATLVLLLAGMIALFSCRRAAVS